MKNHFDCEGSLLVDGLKHFVEPLNTAEYLLFSTPESPLYERLHNALDRPFLARASNSQLVLGWLTGPELPAVSLDCSGLR
jgi:hypothetical protein